MFSKGIVIKNFVDARISKLYKITRVSLERDSLTTEELSL